MTVRLLQIPAHTRRAPSNPATFAEKTVQLFREVRRPQDEAAMDHMAEMLNRCVEEHVAAYGEAD